MDTCGPIAARIGKLGEATTAPIGKAFVAFHAHYRSDLGISMPANTP